MAPKCHTFSRSGKVAPRPVAGLAMREFERKGRERCSTPVRYYPLRIPNNILIKLAKKPRFWSKIKILVKDRNLG